MIKNISDSIVASFKYRWKVFLLSLIIQLLITALLRVGIKAPEMFDVLLLSNISRQAQNLSSPQPAKVDVFESIQPRLEQKENDFEIKNEGSRVSALGAEISALGPASVFAASAENGLPADYDQASAYMVVDLDSGEVMMEKNKDRRLPVASLTKIMTAVVALDLASPEERFAVSQKAADTIPSKINVLAGEKISLEELLHAALLASANDGTEVIREGIDRKYGDRVFVKAMNAKAKALGLKNTSFANPQGFDNRNNYSSAEDLAVLSQYALTKYPEIAQMIQKDYQYIEADREHQEFSLHNWNGLLGVYPGVYGVKIGNTGKAGYTTVVASERDGHRLLVVLLGAPGVLERDLWAAQALDAGFAKFGLDPVWVTSDQLQYKYSTWKY